jgi:hypothetical protein
VYGRRIEGQPLRFGVSGMLLKNALVMFDRETRSLWEHFTGRAIAGPLAGYQLPMLAAVPRVSWARLRREYPEAQVLTVAGLEYVQGDVYTGYKQSRVIGIRNQRARDDRRLPAKAMVAGVLLRSARKAYPFAALGEEGVVNDRIEDTPVVVLRDERAAATAAYARVVGERTLEFEPTVTEGKIRDRTTGTTWSALRGVAVEGPLQGRRLRPVPHVNVYWFAWADYYPETELFRQGAG